MLLLLGLTSLSTADAAALSGDGGSISGAVVAREVARTQVFLAGRYCSSSPAGPCSVLEGVGYDRHDIFGDDDPYNPSVAALYNKTTDHTGAE